GDTARAAAEKRNQLLQGFIALEALDARAEVERIRSNLVAFANRADDKLGKTYNMDVVNAVRAVVAQVGLAESKGKQAAAYLETLQRADPDLYEAVYPSVEAAAALGKTWRDLTVEQVRSLSDEVGSLMHLARRSRQLEVDGNLLDIQEAGDQLRGRLHDLGLPDAAPGTTSAITESEQRLAKFRTLRASLRRVEHWVDQVDGEDKAGPFRKLVWNRIKDAADHYRTEKGQALARYRELLRGIEDTLGPRRVFAPELDYTFGMDSGGSAVNEITHAILHTGNESNLRKLLLGRGWGQERPDGTLDTSRWDAFMARMHHEGVITKAHYDFAQGVWDLLESTKAGAQAAHRDAFGKYFAEVTAQELTTPFGTYRGGYVPAMVDSRIVGDAKMRALVESENQSLQFAFPATNRGFTKGRVEYNRPLYLDLRTLAQHIDKVLLFSNLEVPVRDVRRLLGDVSGTLNRFDSGIISGMFTPWLNRAARQQVTTPMTEDAGLSRFLTTMRARAGMVAMMGNVANAAQQLAGFTSAAVLVKPSSLLSATASYMTGPRAMARAVAEASPYMANRMENEVGAMMEQIDEIMLNPGVIAKAQRWTMKHSQFAQQAVDNIMGPIIWTGAYNDAVASGLDHADAVRSADGAVRQTQGASLPEEVSRAETGNAFTRLFMQFYGYFNMQANLLGSEFGKAVQEGGLRKGYGRALYVFTMGYLANAIVAEAIIQVFRGGPDDEDKDGEFLDDWLKTLLLAPIRFAIAMVPGVGQVANAAVNAWNSKPYDDRISTSPAISMIESAVKAPVSAYKAVAGDGSVKAAVRDVSTLIGMTVGLPASVAAKPLGYVADVQAGKVQPLNAADAARGAITGSAGGMAKH
ncbi:MAG: hypothetical protein KDI12_24550, partial [Anaerolineae bacterium]|nr:hypothetical protein [Anaerolineae bacterium]